jgi:hypothetical protein
MTYDGAVRELNARSPESRGVLFVWAPTELKLEEAADVHLGARFQVGGVS